MSHRYNAWGYDFYCLSDHFLKKYDFPIINTTEHRNENFTTLIGAELHAGALTNGEMWHILANGLPNDFAPPTKDETGPNLAKRAEDAMKVSCLIPLRSFWIGSDSVSLL